MSQSRKQSALESVTNIIIGIVVSLTANAFILPLFGFNVSSKQNLMLGLIYTAISFARSYLLRRIYNRKGEVKSVKEKVFRYSCCNCVSRERCVVELEEELTDTQINKMFSCMFYSKFNRFF